MRSTHKVSSIKTGKGFLNTVIDRFPFEAHITGYNCCGPCTKLKERLDWGDEGINPLDFACRTQDTAYENLELSNNLDIRHIADNLLQEQDWERVKTSDNYKKEKLSDKCYKSQ